MRTMIFALLTCCVASSASATSHHNQVTITPIKNKAGKTTGAEISAVLSASGHTHARIGLLPSRKDMPASDFSLKTDIMKPGSTRWLHLHEVEAFTGGLAEVTMKIDYAKSGIKPGTYQLGSVWNNGPKDQSNSHLWGVEWRPGWGDPEIELPK